MINKLNLLNLLGLYKKTEKVDKSSPEAKADKSPAPRETTSEPAGDSVSVSQEGLIKTTAMEIRQEVETVREDRVEEIKAKISSGEYQVSPQELAKVILRGKTDVFEELK